MNNDFELWHAHFPALVQAADPASARLREQARLLSLEADQPVFQPGAACRNYLLVVEGCVRVQVVGEGGRQVVLYRVGPGQSCILTTSCVLGGAAYPAAGITEVATRAFVVAKPDFDEALETSPAFRRFVFANLGQRLAEVIARIEAVTFQPIDRRLAAYLLEQAAQSGSISVTHEAIAMELGTAREVVSRHLKRLEQRGWVRLARSEVILCDEAALRGLVREPM